MSSFPAVKNANSSASVELVVTVLCFDVFQSIAPLNNMNVYPWELWQVLGSFAKDASLLARNILWESTIWVSNLMDNSRVWTRYNSTRFAQLRWNFDGLVRNSESFDAACAMSGRVMTAAKLIDPTRCWYACIFCGDAVVVDFVSSSKGNDALGHLFSIRTLNFALSLSMYESWQNHRCRVSRSLVIWMPKNHFSSPKDCISYLLKSCAWKVSTSVVFFWSNRTTMSSTKRKKSMKSLVKRYSTPATSSRPKSFKVCDKSLYQRAGDCLRPYNAWRRSNKILSEIVHLSGGLQYVGLSISLLAKALTASYCLVSQSYAAIIAIRTKKTRAASVAANVSWAVCWRSPLAHRCALYLVKNPSLLNLYLKAHMVGIRVLLACVALS